MPSDLTLNVVVPVSLADFTFRDLIVPDLRECDAAGIIGELSQVLQRRGGVTDVLPLYHAALNRELLSNSALECGIAFPHARLSGVKQLQFALGRAPAPVSWCGKSSWPVRLVFLLAVPATDAASYLHLLSCLARLGQQPALVAELLDAETAEQMSLVLSRLKVRAL
jgi:PTS system fructose-specific IIC component